MRHTTLVIPGFHGSGPDHWQTWFEEQVPEARRVRRINYEEPVIGHWTRILRQEIGAADAPVWLVAHGLGCLAAVIAGGDLAERVAGVLLVAPADPTRFNLLGPRQASNDPCGEDNLVRWMPDEKLSFPTIMVASGNDPAVQFGSVTYWAKRWGSRLYNAGYQGHIDPESGYGPWPAGLALYHSLLETQEDLSLHGLEAATAGPGGHHGGFLARLREQTRGNWAFFGRLGF